MVALLALLALLALTALTALSVLQGCAGLDDHALTRLPTPGWQADLIRELADRPSHQGLPTQCTMLHALSEGGEGM